MKISLNAEGFFLELCLDRMWFQWNDPKKMAFIFDILNI
jgi:hypothetical protein